MVEKPSPLTPRPLSPFPSLATPSSPSPVIQNSVSGAFQPDQATSSVKVFVRVRPFNDREKAQGALLAPILKVDAAEPSQVTLLDPKHDFRPKETYTFDHCFWSVVEPTLGDGGWSPRPQSPVALPPYATQADVYNLVGHSVLVNAIEGFNGCIFAYGQTGSGKTFTMMGYEPNTTVATPTVLSRQPSSVVTANGSLATSRRNSSGPTTPRSTPSVVVPEVPPPGCEDWEGAKGIIPRIATEIFEALAVKHTGDSSHSFRVELQYYEVYNEKVYDLFEPSNSNDLRVRQDPLHGPFVEHLTMKCVDNQQTIAKMIKKGSYERHTAATKANERSSRSHAILTITLVQMVLDANDCPQKMVSKVNLVDLAGSERTGLTGAEGQRFTEATKINLSLTTLGRVIDCLADQSTGKANGFTHCPYRESLLTWLLMDSIGGNSKTTMIATISPSVLNFEEVVQTLRYASRARQIVNKAVINDDPQVRRMKELNAEVERLNRIIGEAKMCPYSIQFVSELEDSYRSAQGEIVELRHCNANLRCEVDVLRTKKLRAKQPAASEGVQANADEDASPRAYAANSPTPTGKASHILVSDVAPRQLTFERSDAVPNPSLYFSGTDMEKCLRSRVRELTQAMQEMLKKQRRHTLRSRAEGGDTSVDSVVSSVSFAEKDDVVGAEDSFGEDVMSAEYIHMIEKLALQLDESETALQRLVQSQMDQFHRDALELRDVVLASERDQRDRIGSIASLVRSDIKSLIFRGNAAAEKVIGDKAKEQLAKKHLSELQVIEERWESRLAECKESFAAQLAGERASHEEELRRTREEFAKEFKRVRNNEDERARTGADAQKTVENLQARVESLTQTHQKQILHLKQSHEKDKNKWHEELDSRDSRSAETLRLAVGDAQAKGRAALDDMKKKKEAVVAERDCLAARLAATEEELHKMQSASEGQKLSYAKREKQLQEWQRSLQTIEARELHSIAEKLEHTTRARQASHERHDEDVGQVKSALVGLASHHQRLIDEMERRLTTAVSGVNARILRTESSLRNARCCCARREAQLEAANESLKVQFDEMRAAASAHQETSVELVSKRAESHSRHEVEVQNIRHNHVDHVKEISNAAEENIRAIAAEHEASLRTLVAHSDARVDRLTAALRVQEQLRSREQDLASLLAEEGDARHAIQLTWYEHGLRIIIMHAQLTNRMEGNHQTTTAVKNVLSIVESSEKILEHHLEQQASTVDAMMSTMLSSLRQLRWHQESMLSDARDAFLHQLEKQKSALNSWALEEHHALVDAVNVFHRQSRRDSTALVATAESQSRAYLVSSEATAFSTICQWSEAEMRIGAGAAATAMYQQFHDRCMEELVEHCMSHQTACMKTLLLSHQELAVACDLEQKRTKLLEQQLDTALSEADVRQDAYVGLRMERDHLAATARALELRLGEANLEVLEADLLRSQLEEQSQHMVREESQLNGGGGIVGSIVRRIWSGSQGRSTPAPSTERDGLRSRPSSMANMADGLITSATPAPRLGFGSLNFAIQRLPSSATQLAGAATPRGVTTPRSITAGTRGIVTDFLTTPRRAPPVIMGMPLVNPHAARGTFLSTSDSGVALDNRSPLISQRYRDPAEEH